MPGKNRPFKSLRRCWKEIETWKAPPIAVLSKVEDAKGVVSATIESDAEVVAKIRVKDPV